MLRGTEVTTSRGNPEFSPQVWIPSHAGMVSFVPSIFLEYVPKSMHMNNAFGQVEWWGFVFHHS